MINPWKPNTYDNRGFLDLDARHDFDDYMEKAMDLDGRWSPYESENMVDALFDVDTKRLNADCHLFLSSYRKGDYKICADIFFVMVDEYCRAMAKSEYLTPDVD